MPLRRSVVAVHDVEREPARGRSRRGTSRDAGRLGASGAFGLHLGKTLCRRSVPKLGERSSRGEPNAWLRIGQERTQFRRSSRGRPERGNGEGGVCANVLVGMTERGKKRVRAETYAQAAQGCGGIGRQLGLSIAKEGA